MTRRPHHTFIAVAVPVVVIAALAIGVASAAAPTVPSAESPSPTPTATVVTPATATPITLTRDADPLSVMFVMDSVGYGRNASVQENGFRSLVVADLATSGLVTETAFGSKGDTTEASSALVQMPESLDLVVIELGTNDERVSTAYPQFAMDYQALLTRITTETPDAAIVCVGTLAFYPTAPTYDGIIQQLCEPAGGTYVSIADITADPQYLTQQGELQFEGPSEDSIHPNDAGHYLIAQRILNQITVLPIR